MVETVKTMEMVRDFVKLNFYLSEKNSQIDPDVSLMETGIIDSTGILELIDFLEEKFDIKIENEDISPQNLDSLRNISAFVERKKA